MIVKKIKNTRKPKKPLSNTILETGKKKKGDEGLDLDEEITL